MSNVAQLSKIYEDVILRVIENVRKDFESEGVDETVLTELKQMWQQKLMNSGVISQYGAEATTYQDQHAYAHYQGDQLGAYGDIPGSLPAGHYHQSGRPAPFMHNSAHTAHVAHTLPAGYQATGAAPGPRVTLSGPHHPVTQVDGADDEEEMTITPNVPVPVTISFETEATTTEDVAVARQLKRERPRKTRVAQVDGGDSDEEGDDDGLAEPEGDEGAGAAEEGDDLGSDLDDPDDVNDVETDQLILCQFEKVNRSKNKWKCNLKDGIVHIKDVNSQKVQDLLFHKATGEFEW